MPPWTLIAPETAISQLTPLIDIHHQVGSVRIIPANPGAIIPKTAWQDAANILWVDSARHSPRTGVSGCFLRGLNGHKIPIGWLPNCPERLSTYAQAATAIWQRHLSGAPQGPIALLGSREDRSLNLLDQLEILCKSTASTALKTHRWSAERITRGDLLDALGLGLGAALYVGHGFSHGWHGYAGLSHAHLDQWQGDPLSVLFCITCHNASRHRVAFSFAEELVLSGRCGTVLAATGPTQHRQNQQLAMHLCQIMQPPITAEPPLSASACIKKLGTKRLKMQRYRIIGDPSLPLTGSFASAQRAAEIWAPDLATPLPSLSPSLWPISI
jgi:Peptidase family C25